MDSVTLIQRRLFAAGYDYCDLVDEVALRGWRVLLDVDRDGFCIEIDDGARTLDGHYDAHVLARHTATPWLPDTRDRAARMLRAKLEAKGHIKEAEGV
jgi:hypothetical protein